MKFSLLSKRFALLNPPYHTCSSDHVMSYNKENLGHLCKKDAKRIMKWGHFMNIRQACVCNSL